MQDKDCVERDQLEWVALLTDGDSPAVGECLSIIQAMAEGASELLDKGRATFCEYGDGSSFKTKLRVIRSKLERIEMQFPRERPCQKTA